MLGVNSFIVISMDLTEGIVRVEVGSGIKDEDLDKVGQVIRVALFNFADVMSGGQSKMKMEMQHEDHDHDHPVPPNESDDTPKRMYG